MNNITREDDHGLTPTASADALRVLFVDLDGTLIQTDLLHEMLLMLLKSRIGLLLRAFLKLTRGRAAFKRAISETIIPEIRHLPFRREVLDFISQQKSLGRKIILATATDFIWAQRIADELSIFDNILASDGVNNLKGKAKLDAIQEFCREHGYQEFDYLGNGNADLPIWRRAHGVFMVAPSTRCVEKVREFSKPEAILGTHKSRTRSIMLAMRPRQWVKNLLVFVPLIASHNVFNVTLTILAIKAFACFCLCASAVYVINDLVDIDADRQHLTKRNRPLASGALPISYGLFLATALLVITFTVSCVALPVGFSAVLAIYFVTTCVYSFFLKHKVMIDVLMLSGLYVLRVLAGGLATAIIVSEWLITFSFFLFVSLAFVKRYAELHALPSGHDGTAFGRGYRASDIEIIKNMGPASGYIAVLVLALYINGEQMKLLYHRDWPLWLICPVLMYWISRLWIKASRMEIFEDPFVFAVRDRVSIILGGIILVLVIIASYP
jgi:4-hydroxybenzoate polyprenyltransferase/phosphoserine phosphatase